MIRNDIRNFLFIALIIGLVFLGSSREYMGAQHVVEQQDSYSLYGSVNPQPLPLRHVVPYADVITRFVGQHGGDIAFSTAGGAEQEIPEETTPLPDVEGAQAVLVSDVATGNDIFAFNEIQRWPIASITKLMTSLISFEELDLSGKVVITGQAVSTEGRSGGFSPGEVYTVRDLVNALMIASSNDGAVSLAEFYGYPKFIDRMNVRARALGMVQTNFFEPSGLSVLNQSSAEDLKRLALYVYEHYPEILLISQKQSAQLYEYTTSTFRTIQNVNRYATAETFLGGKTGYIDESRQNLVAFFSRNNSAILMIILGAQNRYSVGNNALNWIDEYYTTGQERALPASSNGRAEDLIN